MEKYSIELLGCADMQEFVDTGVQEPRELKTLTEQSRRRRMRRSPRIWWLITAAALTTALVLGFLLGRWVP